jgi:outer membrane receptor protein involved in Fe transport
MMQRWYQFLCLLLLIAVASTPPAHAATGKIVGIVRDASTKDVIPGANVLVVGTTLGGAADAQGRYYILNVPPGTYSLQASAVGYGRLKIEEVSVVLDQTVEMNITLRSQDVQIGEMVITAERRVVDKNRTSTKTTVTSEELQNLPTVTVMDLLNTTPGAFNGFIRGGRITETKTIVEGVDISNQFYENAQDQTNQNILQSSGYLVRNNVGQLNTTQNLNFAAVEQFSLNTGASGAENQSATAGTINYSLKEGSGPLGGSFQARVSQFNGLHYAGPDVYNLDATYFADQTTTNTRLFANRALRSAIPVGSPVPGSLATSIVTDSIRSGKYSYAPGKYINNNHPLLDFNGSVGGNISDDWRFFVTGKYFDSHGYFPNERNREADISLKTSYNLTNSIKLNAFGIVNDKGILFGWKNSSYQDNARYFLEGVPRNAGIDWVGSLKMTHVLSPATFYEVQVSQTYHNLIYGYTDGNGDGYAGLNENGAFLTMSDQASIDKYISQAGLDLGKFFRIGDEAGPSQINAPMGQGNSQVIITRPQFIYENTKEIARTLRADLTSQVDYHHQIKTGFLFRFHDISQINRNTMLGSDATDTRARLMVDNWEFFPTEMSAYASDRMEFGGLVINLGLRADRWDPKAPDYNNYFALFAPDTLMVDGQLHRVNQALRSANNVDPWWFVSPRIGVSHPISETAALFYSYSRQAIPPPFSRLYSSFYTVFGAAGSFPNFTSLSQSLTKSSNYELGAQWEFLPGKLGLNFTAYMRDVENYSPTAVTIQLATGQNIMWFSGQYADARGLEFSLQAARQKYLDFAVVSGRLSYAYTYIKASGWTGNDPTQPTLFQAGDSSKYGNKLPFTDFIYYNKVQNDIAGGASTLTGGYDRTHRVNYLLSVEFPMDIIFSSLGTFQSGFFYPINFPVDSRVAGRQYATAPWNKMVDVKLEKGFRFDNIRFAVFAEVKNVFNWTNIIGYDNSASGAALWEATNSGNGTTLTNPYYVNTPASGPDPTGLYKRAVGLDGSWFYDIPREFYFGVRVDL